MARPVRAGRLALPIVWMPACTRAPFPSLDCRTDKITTSIYIESENHTNPFSLLKMQCMTRRVAAGASTAYTKGLPTRAHVTTLPIESPPWPTVGAARHGQLKNFGVGDFARPSASSTSPIPPTSPLRSVPFSSSRFTSFNTLGSRCRPLSDLSRRSCGPRDPASAGSTPFSLPSRSRTPRASLTSTAHTPFSSDQNPMSTLVRRRFDLTVI